MRMVLVFCYARAMPEIRETFAPQFTSVELSDPKWTWWRRALNWIGFTIERFPPAHLVDGVPWGFLLQVVRTGETLFHGSSSGVMRGGGTTRPQRLIAGDQVLVIGPAHSG